MTFIIHRLKLALTILVVIAGLWLISHLSAISTSLSSSGDMSQHGPGGVIPEHGPGGVIPEHGPGGVIPGHGPGGVVPEHTGRYSTLGIRT